MDSNSAAVQNLQNQEKIVIHFEDGIYGFENIKDYILLQEDEQKVIWSLQAAESSYPSLIVIDPFLVLNGYNPELTPENLKALGNPEAEDLCFLAVAVIRKNLAESVVNLKSPIVINVKNKKGIQAILEEHDYPVRYKPFRKMQKEGT
ncbi:MAG TPA: flagellar assembly protein FliW [Caproicibacter sp.]|nr:flagellar assembly protein FliW [Caproicibacter sp.]